ncbi:MAG: hypothetical protein HYY60_03330, partial [Parcubacteria group bacterium]|nr:hypothetical protein [Parcubacteria group bacterium]
MPVRNEKDTFPDIFPHRTIPRESPIVVVAHGVNLVFGILLAVVATGIIMSTPMVSGGCTVSSRSVEKPLCR